jgi:hypothetical protein
VQHAFRKPAPEGYGEAFRVQRGRSVACVASPTITVDAAEIFPVRSKRARWTIARSRAASEFIAAAGGVSR